MFKLTPIVKNLIIVNVGVFVIWQLSKYMGMPDREFMYEYFLLFKSNALMGRPWDFFNPVQIVTHFFSHNSILHILFNMMALASLGPIVETVAGPKRFLRFYLFAGLISGVLIAFLDPSNGPVLGASGAISGVLVAFAYFNPHAGLSFFFFPPIKAKYLAGGLAALSALLVLVEMQGRDTGGISHFGHLAGMIGAVIYYYIEQFLPGLKR